MPSAPTQSLFVGQTERVHVKAIANDGTTVDPTVTLTVTSSNPSVCQAQMDPNDNRAVILTALASGSSFVFVDENPPLTQANRLQIVASVTAAPPDNRRVEFVSADPPA